jgi:hypothetical protein
MDSTTEQRPTITIGLKKPISTANAVWLATAMLHKENSQSDAFSAKEIFQKVKQLNLLSVSNSTINMHITSHCVASSKESPDRHRKLTRVRVGWYRLFKEGDSFHETRSTGQIAPLTGMLPLEFKDVIDWYNVQYNVTSTLKSLTESTTSDVEHNMSSELYLIEIGDNNTIKLPDSFVKYCQLVKGQKLAFQAKNNGSIIIRPLRT